MRKKIRQFRITADWSLITLNNSVFPSVLKTAFENSLTHYCGRFSLVIYIFGMLINKMEFYP